MKIREVVRLVRRGKRPTEIMRKTGVKLASVKRLRHRILEHKVDLDAAYAIGWCAKMMMAMAIRAQRRQPEPAHERPAFGLGSKEFVPVVHKIREKRPLTFEEQLARVAAGARLVEVVPVSRWQPDITLGGVVGEINV